MSIAFTRPLACPSNHHGHDHCDHHRDDHVLDKEGELQGNVEEGLAAGAVTLWIWSRGEEAMTA